MKSINAWIRCGAGVAFLLCLSLTSCNQRPASMPVVPPAPQEGLALAIIYDTSGSMRDSVVNASGSKERKNLVARRALNAILDDLAAYASAGSAEMPRVVHAELLMLDDTRPQQVLPMQPFKAEPFKEWLNRFDDPNGSTPLGLALQLASDDLLASPLMRKHILVLTDGENTEGPEPEAVMPGIKARAGQFQAGLQFHFVAFDVNASVFDAVKNQGATVVGAGNEVQLKEQLDYILQKKILLENEEPPVKK